MGQDSPSGKSLPVTGGTTGIGRAIAIDLACQDARILTFGSRGGEVEDADPEEIAAWATYILTRPLRCNVAAAPIIPRLQD